jgi:predicted HicB family RNase H-like nuclease
MRKKKINYQVLEASRKHKAKVSFRTHPKVKAKIIADAEEQGMTVRDYLLHVLDLSQMEKSIID